MQLWNDYFSEDATYPSHMFRRRFRMNKPLFLCIVDRLSAKISYFQQRRDATGRLGHSPLQKATAALRMDAYGCPADTVDEYFRLGETTALLCLKHFVQGIIDLFGDEYLIRPTPEDLQRLLDIGEIRGFPGMHRLYALRVEELSDRMERSIYTWIRKANNCFRGCSFTRSLDMTCVFWTSRYIKRYQCS